MTMSLQIHGYQQLHQHGAYGQAGSGRFILVSAVLLDEVEELAGQLYQAAVRAHMYGGHVPAETDPAAAILHRLPPSWLDAMTEEAVAPTRERLRGLVARCINPPHPDQLRHEVPGVEVRTWTVPESQYEPIATKAQRGRLDHFEAAAGGHQTSATSRGLPSGRSVYALGDSGVWSRIDQSGCGADRYDRRVLEQGLARIVEPLGWWSKQRMRCPSEDEYTLSTAARSLVDLAMTTQIDWAKLYSE